MRIGILALVVALTLGSAGAASAFSLGAFNFDNNQFGNTLLESDAGAFSAGNWLNTANFDPGNPAYLTGASVETGIANIGLGGQTPSYTIGYNTPIANGAGNDLAIISGRFSAADDFFVEVSQDGVNFSAQQTIGFGAAVGTGVMKSYFYSGSGPFDAELFVSAFDLSSFGVGAGNTVSAIRISSLPEGDLIRVAGLDRGPAAIPEPTTLLLLGAGLVPLARRMRKRG